MKRLSLFWLFIGLLLSVVDFATAQSVSKDGKPSPKQIGKIASQPQVSPLGDGLKPEDRRKIFFETIKQTLQQMPPQAQKDLFMVGTGSWMSTDEEKRAKANDIDATISYRSNDHLIAQDFQRKFEENLKNRGLNPPPDITLFVDEKDEGKQDFYRGKTGNYFFYVHSRDNNPYSMFDISLDGNSLRTEPEEVEKFWKLRGKDVPDKIGDAHLFVEDNQKFLSDKYYKEKDLVVKAIAIAKYVDRVEEMLKTEIEKQWGKTIEPPDYVKNVLGTVSCIRRYFHLLEVDLQPSPEDKQRVMDCLGARTEEELKKRVAEFLQQANQYFIETRKQVEQAENEVVLPSDKTPSDEVPDDIIKNTGEVKVIQYFVFLLTNSSNGLYVGSEDSLKGRTRCSFVGGGVGCSPTDVITYKKLLGPFATQAEAQQALCQSITETRFFPVGIGLKGRWQGSNTWYGLWNASVNGCSPR